eukprot:854689-Pelagomonas_calceolata.AAC.13
MASKSMRPVLPTSYSMRRHTTRALRRNRSEGVAWMSSDSTRMPPSSSTTGRVSGAQSRVHTSSPA